MIRGTGALPAAWQLFLGLTLALGGCGDEEVPGLTPVGEIRLGTFTKNQYPIQFEEAVRIAESWRELGLEVKLEPLNFPNPVLERLFQTRDFDAFVLYFTPQLERLEPDFFTYHSFHSANAGPGGWNIAGYRSADFDRLAEQQRTAYDGGVRRELILRCQELLYQDNPWVVIVNQDELQAYNRRNFKDPVLLRTGGFKDPMAFFTIRPAGGRRQIRWAVEWADLKTINPLLVSESTQVRILHFIYDTLVRRGADLEPRLWAARRIQAVDDRTFEVTLREDLQFHDGTPLSAEDVAFSFEFLRDHKAVYFRTFLDPLERVEALSRHELRFHLRHPYAPFVSQTLGLTPLLPRHLWERLDQPTDYRNLPPVGSGPFRFDHWKEAQELRMSRFEEHFASPLVSEVLVVFYGTREAAFTALLREETDGLDTLVPHQIKQLEAFAAIETIRMPSHSIDAVVFNLRKEPFSDSKLRLALAHAIPSEEILDELYMGYGNRGASLIAPANVAWTHPDLKPYPYDLEKAKAILRDAGYEWDRRGRLSRPVE